MDDLYNVNFLLRDFLGIEKTKRLTIDEIDDQRAMLENDLTRMSREAQKNALLSENENNLLEIGSGRSSGPKTVRSSFHNTFDSLEIIIIF